MIARRLDKIVRNTGELASLGISSTYQLRDCAVLPTFEGKLAQETLEAMVELADLREELKNVL